MIFFIGKINRKMIRKTTYITIYIPISNMLAQEGFHDRPCNMLPRKCFRSWLCKEVACLGILAFSSQLFRGGLRNPPKMDISKYKIKHKIQIHTKCKIHINTTIGVALCIYLYFA